MKQCELQNPKARQTMARVWRHLWAHFPDDFRFLYAIVKGILPLNEDAAADGTQGEWFCTPPATWEEQQAFNALGAHGQGYGTIKLLDADELTAGTIAHELGHAFTSCEDLFERGAPSDEWASEAAADMHAVRWGLLTVESILRRYEENVFAVEGQGTTINPAFAHHGPPPSGCPFEIYGNRWKLGDDFVFEIV